MYVLLEVMCHQHGCIKSKVSGLYRRGGMCDFCPKTHKYKKSRIMPNLEYPGTRLPRQVLAKHKIRQSPPPDPAHLTQRRAKLGLHDMADSKRLRVQIDLYDDRIMPHLLKREHLPRTVGARYHFHL